MYVYLQNDLHNIIIFKQFIGQTSDKLHGHNSYMQLIFSLIHKQDSINLPMNKQSLAGVYNAMTQKKNICVGDYLDFPIKILLLLHQTKPNPCMEFKKI